MSASNNPDERAADFQSDGTTLPEHGGIFWYMGGVPASKLPPPCVECLKFIAKMTAQDNLRLIEQVNQEFSSGQ
jgi:hypothetical protein